jgi:hypothetical protein
MVDGIGWLATAVFLLSYLTARAVTLRRVQAVAACLWATYGVLIHSLPVIVANILVATFAIASSWRRAGATT